MGQWHGGAIDQCKLSFEGEIADKDTRVLVSAFCAGLLGDKIEGANIVNAEVLCRERGIEIERTSSSEHGAFASMISATVKGEGKKAASGWNRVWQKHASFSQTQRVPDRSLHGW